VHLYWASLPRALTDIERSAYLATLSEPERRRHARFIFPSVADEYLAAHAVLRATLSRFVDVPPHAWRFRRSEQGRPEIDGAADVDGLRFSLSHTRGLVGCAVAWGSDVGIDLEAIQPHRPAPTQIAERSFAPAEVATLRAAAPAQRTRLFYELWTLKEAYLKARGLGLTVPLTWVTFSFHPGSPIAVQLHPALDDVADAWDFRLLQPTSGHMMALAMRRRAPSDLISIEEIDLYGLVAER